MQTKHAGIAVCLAAAMVATAAQAGPTREDLAAWIAEAPPPVLPDAGTVLGQQDMATIRALLPPGYAEQFDFADAALEIQATARIEPHAAYREATARHQDEASIAANGSLQNYGAGQPFSTGQIESATPDQAGLMVAWNRIHRWQYYGWKVDEVVMNYLRPTTGTGKLTDGLEGGGNVDRWMLQSYHLVYLNHIATLPEQGYRVNASDSSTRLFKEYAEFLEPFDVKGTKFVVERPLDATDEDQVNSYLPTQRRVRRLSAQERADSFMGSDMTMDDFEGFSGRVLDYDWTYLGHRQVLHVADGKAPVQTFYGPQSWVPKDRWQVREAFAVEITPKWARHPYASKIIFFDTETFNVTVAVACNRQGEVWRIFAPSYTLPPEAERASGAPEASVPRWLSTLVIDRIANTATVARARTPTETPTMSESAINRRFNISTLTEGR